MFELAICFFYLFDAISVIAIARRFIAFTRFYEEE